MSNLETTRGQRLDQYVAEKLGPSISRAFAAKLIETGKVTISGNIAEKAGYKVRPQDDIVIDFVPESVVAPDITLPILYEDDDCVVIDKPIGLLVHSKGAFNPEATVASWLLGRVVDQPLSNRAGIVHRLDRATSGVMICAKTTDALSRLQKQFSDRKAKKTYYAIVSGVPAEPEAIIDMPIERNPKQPAMFRAGPNGKPAVTRYKVLETQGDYSLLELKPTTGRTHQLRVHLKQIGHPIVGDTFYDGAPADRLFLHAETLEITTPDTIRREFKAPLPAAFKELMAHAADSAR